MKRYFLLVLIVLPMLLPVLNFAQEEEHLINWMTIEEALEAQKQEPRKIMIDVYTNWCNPCKMLDKVTFHNQDVADYVNEHFYAVKFNAEYPDPITYKDKVFSNPNFDPEVTRGRNGVHQLSRAFGVSAYPTIAYLDENGDMITSIAGYMKPQQLEIYLNLFALDHFKTIDTKEKWEEYQASFEPTFKE